MTDSSATQLHKGGIFLTFSLEGQVFGVDVLNVREVVDLQPITALPHSPSYVRGVINLRGRVLPVVDMRAKFQRPQADDSVDTAIIVLDLILGGEATILGALVDQVREVTELSADEIEPRPRMGFQLNTELIVGLGRRDADFIILLDCERVFGAALVDFVSDASHSPAQADSERCMGRSETLADRQAHAQATG